MVGIMTRLLAGQFRHQFLAGEETFLFSKYSDGYRVHPASYSIHARSSFLGG